jgi:hypothetical protein
VRFLVLTGRWWGRYEQAPGGPVPFEAELSEDDGSITGETSEPNTFRGDMGAALTATLTGGRAGAEVNFLKQYHGFVQDDCPVYQGTANAALTRIEGQWSFPSWPGLTGRFVMMRKPQAEAKARTEARQAEPEALR